MSKLATQPIKRLLISLAIPMIIAYIVQALYNIVDTIFVGQAVGALGIAALGIVFPLQLILSGISMLFAAGGAALISIYLGKRDLLQASKIASVSYILAIAVTLIAAILSAIFMNSLLQAFGATPDILPYAYQYMMLVMIGLPFVAVANVATLVLRAQGKPRYGMVVMIVGTVLNIVLNPILVFGLHLDVAGAAIATVIAQALSGGLAMYFAFVRPHDIKAVKITMKQLWTDGKEVTKIGLPSFIGTMTFSIVVIVSNVILSIYGGSNDIALFGIIMKINELMVLPLFGLIAGMQPIVGFNYGAGNYDRVKKTFAMTLKFACGFLIICMILIEIFPSQILSIFSSESSFVSSGDFALRVVFSLFVFTGIQLTCSTYLQSLNCKKEATFISLLRQIILYIPIVIILTLILASINPSLAVNAVWFGLPISDFFSGIIGFIIAKRTEKKILSI